GRAAPEFVLLPVPGTLAAARGEGAGTRGCGATTGVGSAFFATAPCGFFIAWGLGTGLRGGWIGGGGGGSRRFNVVTTSTACRTCCTLSPEMNTNASATWIATTATIAFARSGP